MLTDWGNQYGFKSMRELLGYLQTKEMIAEIQNTQNLGL